MLSGSTSAASSGPGRSVQALLPLKLNAPPLRTGVVLRPDLQALLAEVRLNPLTLVVAPAGYGKTTLLAQWVQELTRTGAPVGWLTLDSSERNPSLFLAYLIGAFQTVIPALGVDAWRLLHSAVNLERDWPLVAGALCSDLQRNMPAATFLFLDDLHLVTDSAVITQILGYLLRAAPPHLHLVMAARRAPTFAPLARLRAERRLVDVSQRDLHLSADQVRRLLAMQGVELSSAELALLLQRTEGWALSVQLAARALATQPAERRSAFVRALDGSQEQLLNYLATEVLADLPQELIDFLRLAALPESFDAPLLHEVLARDDVAYLLQRAQALGLPLLPLDKRGDRLRFHPLWREVLLREFPKASDQRALHRRFGQAFEGRGDFDAALAHYAHASAADDLLRLLRERAWPLLRSPQRDLVHRWLEQLSPDVRDQDATLLHLWSVSQAATGPGPAMEGIARAIRLYRQAGLFQRELRAFADLLTVMAWQAAPADHDAICVQAIGAANRVRDAWSRGAARVCVVMMLYNKGRYAAALRVGRQATALPLYPTWHWLLTMTTSSINTQLGRPAEALAAIAETLQLPQVDLDDRLRQSLFRVQALAMYQQGQVSEALALALDTHRQLGNYSRGGVSGASAAQLALMLALQGRLDEAMTYIAQARGTFHAIGDTTALARVQAIEVYITFAHGQVADACMAVGGVLRRMHAPGHAAPDLSLELLLLLVLGEGGQLMQALGLLRDLVQQMQQHGYRLPLACAHLYLAYLSEQSGDRETWRAALRAGWELVAVDDWRYLPMLPIAAIQHVVTAAIREGIALPAVGKVLRWQIPEQGRALLQGMLTEPAASVRADIAHLLGQLGVATAYPPLRALTKDRDATVRRVAEEGLRRLVYRPPYMLRIRTLGTFRLWRGNEEVQDRDWRSNKARQLFQLLLTERGHMLARERVLEALWPNMESLAAANNLRVTLTRLIKAIEPDRPEGAPSSYIVQQGDGFAFNLSCDYQLDAADFGAAVAAAQREERRGQRQAAIDTFRQAVALYGGQYLPDAVYEDWSVVERERLAMLFDDAALRLGNLLLEEGAAHEAIGLAWRVLEHDHAQEDAYRLLMRAHAMLGERAAALRLYTRCVSVLQSELGVEPMPETVALYNSLRDMR